MNTDTITRAEYQIDWMAHLLASGWEVKHVKVGLGGSGYVKDYFQWRTPDGMGGSDYCTKSLIEFPVGVHKWIHEQPQASPVLEN